MIFTTTQNADHKGLGFVAGATITCGILLSLSAELNSYLYKIIPEAQIVMSMSGTASGSDGFMTGFTMQFINPNVALFTLTVINNFIVPTYSATADIAIFLPIPTFIGLS